MSSQRARGSVRVCRSAGGMIEALEQRRLLSVAVDFSGIVFDDANLDGVKGSREDVLPGWTVELRRPGDRDPIASTISDSRGVYLMELSLNPGGYYLSEVVPMGWARTAPPTGHYFFEITVSDSYRNLHFGNARTGELHGIKYSDEDVDGVRDIGYYTEPGLPGWTIQLSAMDGSPLTSTTTGADGTYAFTNIAPGSYLISEVQQPGWLQTAPATGTHTANLAPGGNLAGLDFGNAPPAEIRGYAFNDLNLDGIRDAGEAGLDGWTITLDEHGDGIIDQTTVTAADGSYVFPAVRHGHYRVGEILQPGWVRTRPSYPGYYNFDVESGDTYWNINFGNVAEGGIHGTLFDDVNDDGVHQLGEALLAGWTVMLRSSLGSVLATTTTSMLGVYSFTGIAPDTYLVTEVLQSGWIHTSPAADTQTVILPAGGTVNDAHFGNTQGGFIDFEDLAADTVVTTQYHERGVDFAVRPRDTQAVITELPFGYPSSGVRIADISVPSPGSEFPLPILEGRLVQMASLVSVQVGLPRFWMGAVPVTLTAYDANHQVVGTAGPVEPSGMFAQTRLKVVSATPNIAYFTVTAPSIVSPVGIDDLRFITPVANPDFSLTTPAQFVNVGPGGSNTASILIGRLNGSTGSIQFSASGLPAGVSASFAPNPAGADSTILTLSAAPGTPVTPYEGVPITITGTPLDGSAGTAARSVSLNLVIRKNFTVSVDLATKVMALGAVVPVKLTRLLEYTQTVWLQASGLPSGMTATFTPPTIEEADYNSTAIAISQLRLTADPYGPLTPFTLTITATAGSEIDQTSFYVTRIPGFVDSITPSWTYAPQSLKTGTLVVLKGDGFLPGSTVQFGSSGDLAGAIYVSPDYTELNVLVPRLASSGNLTIRTPNGRQFSSTIPVTVNSYRSQNGYSFHNPTAGGVSWGDCEDLFGYDQMHWLFIPSPLAWIFQEIADAALDDGQCYGVSRTSQMFLQGNASVYNYPTSGPTVWDLTGPGGPSSSLYHFIHVQHTAQISAEGIARTKNEWWNHMTGNGEAHVKNDILTALAAGDHPLVSMLNGASGHTVVAYDLTDDPLDPTGYYIWTYDPNRPYETAEESNYALHAQRELNGRIHVTGGRWYRIRDDSANPTVWSGKMQTLVVTRYGDVPYEPTMPASIAGIWEMITGDAVAEQIADSAGHFLFNPDGTMNDDPDTLLPDSLVYGLVDEPGFQPLLLLGGDACTRTIRGTGNGVYSELLLGEGLGVRLTDVPIVEGLADQIEFDPGAGRYAFRTESHSKPYDVEFIASVGVPGSAEAGGATAERSVKIHGVSFAGGQETFSFSADREQFTYVHHGGTTSVQLVFSQVDAAGFPQTFVSQAMTVLTGETITCAPEDWSQLNETRLLGTRISPEGNVVGIELLRQAATIAITGSAGADTYCISLDPTGQLIQAFDSYPPGPSPIQEIPADASAGVFVNTLGGGDRLFVSLAHGDPFPAGLLYTSSGYSTLTILDPRPTDTLEFGDGAVILNGSTILHCTTANDRYIDSETADVIRLTSLTVSGGVQAKMGWTSPVLSTGTLSIAEEAQFDLGSAAMIVREGSLAEVRRFISTARNAYPAQFWTGPGLTSWLAAAGRLPATGLSCVLNRDQAGAPLQLVWENEPVDENCILIKNLLVGDTTQDGRIDGSDYRELDRAFLCRDLGNACADADYSGRIDGDDYYLLDCSFLGQAAVMAPASAATPAEPPNPPAVRPQPEVLAHDATAPATAIWPWSSQSVRAAARDVPRVPADDAVSLLPDEDVLLGRCDNVLA